MQHGFEATSMRLLTSTARVNLAAVNYHFGSKDALIEALFHRRLDPMNAERIAALDALEQQAGEQPLAPEQIIRAFIGASLRMIEDAKGGGRNFIRLLGRDLYRAGEADPGPDRPAPRARHGALQGRLRQGAARGPARRAGLAHALHVRHAVVHPGGDRHGAAYRRLQARGPLRRAAARGAPGRVPLPPACSRRCRSTATSGKPPRQEETRHARIHHRLRRRPGSRAGFRRAAAPGRDQRSAARRCIAASCRTCRRPSARRSTPARSGGTATCSPAVRTGTSCSPCRRRSSRPRSRPSSTARARSCARCATTGRSPTSARTCRRTCGSS